MTHSFEMFPSPTGEQRVNVRIAFDPAQTPGHDPHLQAKEGLIQLSGRASDAQTSAPSAAMLDVLCALGQIGIPTGDRSLAMWFNPDIPSVELQVPVRAVDQLRRLLREGQLGELTLSP